VVFVALWGEVACPICKKNYKHPANTKYTSWPSLYFLLILLLNFHPMEQSFALLGSPGNNFEVEFFISKSKPCSKKMEDTDKEQKGDILTKISSSTISFVYF
jgi:hypothetical protein